MSRFWSHQPVHGTVADLSAANPSEPIRLPTGFEWVAFSKDDDADMARVSAFLNAHYGTSEDGKFSSETDPSFVSWSFRREDQPGDWIVGVRVVETDAIVAAVCAWPWKIRVDEEEHASAQIGFLCVHPILRNKRLAPVLIREITRRVVARGCVRAVYTGHDDLPGRVTTMRKHVRVLRADPLVQSGFWPLRPPMTPPRLQRLNKLPDRATIGDMVEPAETDVDAIVRFLNERWSAYRVAPVATHAWVRHVFARADSPIRCRIRKGADGTVTDLWSYYPKRTKVTDPNSPVRAFDGAEGFYAFATSVDPVDLFRDAMTCAKAEGCALWVDTDAMHSKGVRDALRMEPNPTTLHLFLYNWGAFEPVGPEQTAVVCW